MKQLTYDVQTGETKMIDMSDIIEPIEELIPIKSDSERIAELEAEVAALKTQLNSL